MKRTSVRIIQSLSDYPGNMELAVSGRGGCNCGCAVSVYFSERAVCVLMLGLCVASLKSGAFSSFFSLSLFGE